MTSRYRIIYQKGEAVKAFKTVLKAHRVLKSKTHRVLRSKTHRVLC